MRKSALLVLVVLGLALLGASVSAAPVSVPAKFQLRGHLPELGERPTMRVFQTQAAYDAYRTSLGDANVFPPASSMFMSFDKDILALYTRGNDTGGRCFATSPTAALDAETVTIDLSFQSGTCGAPASAHYPFILVSLSRTAADGSLWVSPVRQLCAAAPGVADSRSCASLSGTSATTAPTASPSPAPTATGTQTAAPSATATRTLTPTASASVAATASPTAQTATRSPVAAASPSRGPEADPGTNYILYGALIAVGFLVGIALMLSRGSGGARRGR